MISMVAKLRRLLSQREQWHALLLLGMMMFGAVLEMVGVGAIPAFITLLSAPSRVEKYAAVRSALAHLPPHSEAELALWGAAVLLLIFLLKNTYLALVSALQARYVTNRQIKIAGRVFHAYLDSPYALHLRRNSAELLRNATNEAMEVVGSVLMPLLTLVMETLTVAAIFALLLVAEPFISLVAVGLLGGASLVFARAIRRRLIHHGHAMQLHRMKMLQAVNEGLGSLKVTRVLRRESYFFHAFMASAEKFAAATRYRQVMLDLPRLYLETAAMAGILGVAAILIAERRPIDVVIPVLSLLAVAVVRMIPSFNRITSSLTTLRYGRYALEAVYNDLMSVHARADVRGQAADALPFHRSIELRHVDFTYPGAARAALSDITLAIPRGGVVGFVGPTGSGKTTLVDIILGLLDPTRGEILVDGREIRDNLVSWQRHIGYVPQDIYLTDDSIRRNIALGVREDEIDDAAVQRALQAAHLSDFVASLQAGLETEIGERGVRLSGGQRQRIGIARALYHEPDVLILDEATSSLDNETERFVMQAVEHLRDERTIILVAHRMSTVRGCDRLYLLKDGCLIADGSFDSLLVENDRFKALVGAEWAESPDRDPERSSRWA